MTDAHQHANDCMLLRRRPSGLPTLDCFEAFVQPLAPLAAGKVRCQTLYLSLDPYIRSVIAGNHMGHGIEPGEVIPGETVARIVDSNCSDWPIGTLVRCDGGWQHFSDHTAEDLHPLPPGLLHPSLALSVLGMPGLTAFAGIHRLAQVTVGDTVVIPAAVGGVGAMAGQLARLAGAKTIAITSGQKKRQIALEQLGYSACIDRDQDDVATVLAAEAPEGVSVYFDLVGDPLLTTVSQQLAIGGRIVLCGLMGDYNGIQKTTGPPPGLWIGKRATVKGLVVYDFEHERSDFEQAYIPLVRDGVIQTNVEFHVGLACAPEAFCRLMRGENTGKVVVQLAVSEQGV